MLLIKKRDRNSESISKLESQVELTKEANSKDIKIEFYIRNGLDDHEGISMSKETGILRKKLMGILPDEEWNDYTTFIEKCISKVSEEISE
ncbi:MAG: hypothetical protein IKR19_00535 [Acholeplasmatales bacterium]|nr:hypothetical protein [Acholeplasmatales bacterium]